MHVAEPYKFSPYITVVDQLSVYYYQLIELSIECLQFTGPKVAVPLIITVHPFREHIHGYVTKTRIKIGSVCNNRHM